MNNKPIQRVKYNKQSAAYNSVEQLWNMVLDMQRELDALHETVHSEITPKQIKKILQNHDIQAYCISVIASDTAVSTGDGTDAFTVPEKWNGKDITGVIVSVHTKGITGTTDVQLRRRRAGSDVDVLSTKVTIGDEYYASDCVVNTSNDDLQTGDQLYVDIDAVHSGTAPNGLSVTVVVG